LYSIIPRLSRTKQKKDKIGQAKYSLHFESRLEEGKSKTPPGQAGTPTVCLTASNEKHVMIKVAASGLLLNKPK
jgi:hypothetical protein